MQIKVTHRTEVIPCLLEAEAALLKYEKVQFIATSSWDQLDMIVKLLKWKNPRLHEYQDISTNPDDEVSNELTLSVHPEDRAGSPGEGREGLPDEQARGLSLQGE